MWVKREEGQRFVRKVSDVMTVKGVSILGGRSWVLCVGEMGWKSFSSVCTYNDASSTLLTISVSFLSLLGIS